MLLEYSSILLKKKQSYKKTIAFLWKEEKSSV